MRRVAEGVWQLAGVPRDVVNIYLAGDVLIDTGTRWAYPRIVRQLGLRRLALVALTHAHPDHQGSARLVCRHRGVPLACHEADVAAVEGHRPMIAHPSPLLHRLSRLFGGPPCTVGRVLRDGDRVGDFRVIHAPGHTPGHVFYFRESDRVCLAGDVLANMNVFTGRPGLREPPRAFSHDPARNRRSMQALVALRPSVVCLGHGPPLYELAALERYVARLGPSPVLS
jgi:glyoxylase-like metal-dependent hydrolase (beta-lactamase superfamily II)